MNNDQGIGNDKKCKMQNVKFEEKVQFFESRILDFFKKAGRESLPWRREGISAYEVWVSEVMLQQTQVSRVISYYEKFLARFPSIEMLAAASWDEFLPYYAGLGYYARGRNMLRAAKMVVEDFDGVFPRDVRELEALPGIGSYTASAIASFAYGENTIAWDTNVRRVIGRYFVGTRYAGTRKFQVPNSKIQIISKSQFSNKKNKRETVKNWVLKMGNGKWEIEKLFSIHAKVLNAALMDFGSAICLGKPKCATCPLLERCTYFGEKGRNELKMKNDHAYRQAGKLKMRRKKPDKEIKKGIWREAKVEVTLHENHRKYFSSSRKSYRPFFLPASHNTRAGIKSWFRERYGLEVSVRPPHGKITREGVPTILVNAQILSGTPRFAIFPPPKRKNGTLI